LREGVGEASLHVGCKLVSALLNALRLNTDVGIGVLCAGVRGGW
jgi:hypothetical protein